MMKYKKIFGSLLLVSILFCSSLSQAFAINFGDLQGYGWAKDYIDDVANKKIISGYPDGTFKPGLSVTRIETLVMIANLYPKEEIDSIYKNKLSKYDAMLDKYNIDDWAKPYIIFALEKNFISASTTNLNELLEIFVHPSDKKPFTARRYEVAVFLVRGLHLESELNTSAKLAYKDTKDIPSQAFPYIELLQRKGILSRDGDDKGFFNPKKPITRAETAVMMSKAYKYSSKAKGQSSLPKPTEPKATKNETFEGKIDLLTFSDDSMTVAINTKDSGVKNYTAKKTDVVIKMGNTPASINDLKIGQYATFTVSENKLIQIAVAEKEERYSGILSDYNKENKTLTLLIEDEKRTFKYTDDSKIYVNDVLTPIDKLPKENTIDIYVKNSLITKASLTVTKNEFTGEITNYSNNSISIRFEDSTITKQFADEIKLYRNDKRVDSMSMLAIGDIATIKTDHDKVTEIDVQAKKAEYIKAVIKEINMNSNYNTLTISDREKKDHVLTINNDTIIRIDNTKVNIYSLKIGYEVDVYVEGGLIEEIQSTGNYKQETVSGTVTYVDTVDKYITIKKTDDNQIRVYYDIDTKIERVSNGVKIETSKIRTNDEISAIGIMSGGNIDAIRILADI